jgi:hypothetical protein
MILYVVEVSSIKDAIYDKKRQEYKDTLAFKLNQQTGAYLSLKLLADLMKMSL